MSRARVQIGGTTLPIDETAEAGTVLLLPDGRYGVADGQGAAYVDGLIGVLKVAGDRFEPGGVVRWDGSRARLEGDELLVLGSAAGAGGAMDEELTVMLNG